MSDRAPAFQFYPKQWLGDDNVMLMDLDAQGLHVRFMCIAWQQTPPCTLPNDDAVLRRWAGNPRNWSKLKEQVFRAWRLEGDRHTQDGLMREFNKQAQYSASRAANASKRWKIQEVNSAHAEPVQRMCETRAMHAVCSSSSSSKIEESPSYSPLGNWKSPEHSDTPPPPPKPTAQRRLTTERGLPEEFEISDAVWEWTAKQSYPREWVEREFAKFCDRNRAVAGRYTDWDAALRNWFRRAADPPAGNNGWHRQSSASPRLPVKQVVL